MVRVVSTKPLDIVRSLVRNHLTEIWLRPEYLIAIANPLSPDPGPARDCFADSSLTTRISPAALDARVIYSSGRQGDPTFAVVGSVGLPAPVAIAIATQPMMLLMTDASEILFALETDAAIHDDGTVQIYGAEHSVVLLPSARGKEQLGKPLIRGGTAMRSIALEKRDSNGVWATATMQIEIDAKATVSDD